MHETGVLFGNFKGKNDVILKTFVFSWDFQEGPCGNSNTISI